MTIWCNGFVLSAVDNISSTQCAAMDSGLKGELFRYCISIVADCFMYFSNFITLSQLLA